MDTGLNEKVALITGGASGIGLATARALLAEGCRVVLADLNPAGAHEKLAQFDAARVHTVSADISQADRARALAHEAADHFGRLDVLVTSAGVYETTGLDLDDEEWDRTMDVNVSGTFNCAREAIKLMTPRHWGRIITLSSMAFQTGGGAAGPAYVTSKAAVIGLTKYLAKNAGPHGITVNAVLPGFIETPMTGKIASEDQQALAAGTPLRRNGTAVDVANVITMLASEGAGFVTGARISVNGGLVMD